MRNEKEFIMTIPGVVFKGPGFSFPMFESAREALAHVKAFNDSAKKFNMLHNVYWTVEVFTPSGSQGFINIQQGHLNLLKNIMGLRGDRVEFTRIY